MGVAIGSADLGSWGLREVKGVAIGCADLGSWGLPFDQSIWSDNNKKYGGLYISSIMFKNMG